jgi:hypothetical protein
MEEPLALERIRQVAKSIAPDRVIAAITTDATNIKYGQAITVTGEFTIRDKSPLAGVPIRIEGKAPNEETWRLLATATTDVTGKFVKPLIVGRSTSIRAYSEGSWERSEGVSNAIDISISRLLVLSAPTSILQGESFTVSGSIRPRVEANLITLETLSNGKWVALGAPVPTDSRGEFSFEVKNTKRGVLTLRVSAAAQALYPITTSPQFSILIRGPFTPELVK